MLLCLIVKTVWGNSTGYVVQGQEGSGHQQSHSMKDVDVSPGFLGSQGKVLSGCGWVEIAYVSTRQI